MNHLESLYRVLILPLNKLVLCSLKEIWFVLGASRIYCIVQCVDVRSVVFVRGHNSNINTIIALSVLKSWM